MKKRATKADSDDVQGEKQSPPLEAEDEAAASRVAAGIVAVAKVLGVEPSALCDEYSKAGEHA